MAASSSGGGQKKKKTRIDKNMEFSKNDDVTYPTAKKIRGRSTCTPPSRSDLTEGKQTGKKPKAWAAAAAACGQLAAGTGRWWGITWQSAPCNTGRVQNDTGNDFEYPGTGVGDQLYVMTTEPI